MQKKISRISIVFHHRRWEKSVLDVDLKKRDRLLTNG